ncbi:MAG: universal stress protein [bacterium]
MEKILLAVDGSENSVKAAKKAGELAVALEATVTILTVVTKDNMNSPVHSQFEIERLIKEREKKIQEQGNEILNKTANILKSFHQEKEIVINKLLSSGDPAENICEEAENNDYDLIILASTGEGGVKRFLLGSTSDRVARHAGTSVLIAKK